MYIDGDTFFLFMKNTWIGDSGVLCHITNNDIGLFDVINIKELIKGSSIIMPATKKDKLHVNEWQVDGTKQIHTLWSLKFCPKASANLFFPMCKLYQEKTISSNHQNNIMVNSMDGNIFLY